MLEEVVKSHKCPYCDKPCGNEWCPYTECDHQWSSWSTATKDTRLEMRFCMKCKQEQYLVPKGVEITAEDLK